MHTKILILDSIIQDALNLKNETSRTAQFNFSECGRFDNYYELENNNIQVKNILFNRISK